MMLAKSNIALGVAGGAAGSLAAAVPMLVERWTGLLPRFDAIGLLAGLVQRYGAIPVGDAAGWTAHAVLGTLVWGPLYGLIASRLRRGGGPLAGAVFALGPWLGMTLALWPLYGSFPAAVAVGIPLFALVFHLVYGATLGWTVRRLAADR